MPWRAVRLLLLAALTWAGGVVYTLKWNPEINFSRHSTQIKLAWANSLRTARGAKTIVCGGSSCAFSLDGERLLERHGLPVANFGLMAGTGAKTLVLFAREALQTGDTLVLALEPGLFTERFAPTSLGVQFSFAVGHPEWITDEQFGSTSASRLAAVLALRPGGYHLITMIGKLVQHRPLYRFRLSDVRPGGWLQTDVRLPINGPPGHGPDLSPDARLFLGKLRDWCDSQGIRLVYSLPWAYAPPAKAAAFQRDNAAFLLQMMEFMPALKDPRLGAYPVVEHFSDTAWHLDAMGAALRTDSFAEQLKSWSVWTRAELHRIK